jgi:hypothetical protein
MGTLLTSAVIAALVAALFSVLTSERRIAAENVIQERKKWRDTVRDLASEVFKALHLSDADRVNRIRELRGKFALLVNPHEDKDQQILELIVVEGAGRADEFIQRVALLLKHDWERAKREASLWRRLWEKEPMRACFEGFRPGVKHDYRNGRFY